MRSWHYAGVRQALALFIGLVRSEKAEDRPQALRYVVPSTNTTSAMGRPSTF